MITKVMRNSRHVYIEGVKGAVKYPARLSNIEAVQKYREIGTENKAKPVVEKKEIKKNDNIDFDSLTRNDLIERLKKAGIKKVSGVILARCSKESLLMTCKGL